MKWFLMVLLMASFLMSEEIGRYQLSVSTAVSKKGKIYVVEAVIDTKTGKIVKRNKISLYDYGKTNGEKGKKR